MLFIDAHMHFGHPGVFFAPETAISDFLAHMDRLFISHAVCFSSQLSICDKGAAEDMTVFRDLFEKTGGRIYYLGVFHPEYSDACLKSFRDALSWPGFRGIKIHPSFHGISADDPVYEPVWQFVSEHDLALATHSWSASPYNPVQVLSTPARFEKYVSRFPDVRFILGHSGGRGAGRGEALLLVKEYPNVYLDFAGDIFCYRMIENLVESVSADRFMFASDFPWIDIRANLSRVLCAEVSDTDKAKILRDTAASVYRIE